MMEVRELGVVPYEDAQALMKELQQKRIDGQIPDTLLILSHPEVVTVGPRAVSYTHLTLPTILLV